MLTGLAIATVQYNCYYGCYGRDVVDVVVVVIIVVDDDDDHYNYYYFCLFRTIDKVTN